MFTVALIGPDGSGKSTISHDLEKRFPLPVRRIYMGINRKESNYILPTTRLLLFLKRGSNQGGPRDSGDKPQRSKNLVKRFLKELKSGIRLLDTLTEEWYRQLVAWVFTRRGYVVIFDRHYYADFYQYTIDQANKDDHWVSRIHGYLLQNSYPKPDLVIFLDAPASVLFERKGEGTIKLLEERRQSYLQLQSIVPNFEVVDATASVDVVYRQVEEVILAFMENNFRKK